MFEKLKQYKDMARQAKEIQARLAQETVTAGALGGKIKLVIDGNQEIMSCEIDSTLLSPEKKDEVEKGFREAANSAIKKAQRVMADSMRNSGMSLPGM